MSNIQQLETLKYFNHHAKGWARSADINSPNDVNVVKQRNDVVLTVINERKQTRSALDIGCGTGDLVCQIALKDICATGIDFSKKMINIAERKARKLKCTKAKFICKSIFDFRFEPNKYDVISANGFIEYISYKDLNLFLSFCKKSLGTGKSLVLGSRNRLFNIFSLNKFTLEEIRTGEIDQLIMEAILLINTKNIDDVTNFKSAPLQAKNKKHIHTGINVSTRFQYTPVQLINMLRKHGFETQNLYPIHIHGIPPEMKDKYSSIHGSISNFLQKWTQKNKNFYLIPQSSSFMIHAIKK